MKTGIPPAVSTASNRVPGADLQAQKANKAPAPDTAKAPGRLDTPAQNTASEASKAASETRSTENLQKLLEDLNIEMENLRRGLSFRVDEELGEIIIKVVDQETDEVIRQIPAEEIVEFSRRIREVNRILFEDIRA